MKKLVSFIVLKILPQVQIPYCHVHKTRNYFCFDLKLHCCWSQYLNLNLNYCSPNLVYLDQEWKVGQEARQDRDRGRIWPLSWTLWRTRWKREMKRNQGVQGPRRLWSLHWTQLSQLYPGLKGFFDLYLLDQGYIMNKNYYVIRTSAVHKNTFKTKKGTTLVSRNTY